MSNPITPNHYQITTDGEELIDVNFLMEKYLTSTQLKLSITQSGYLTNIVEYILRADRKDGIKDIEKAINNAILLLVSFYKSGQIKEEYIKNLIEKLKKENENNFIC